MSRKYASRFPPDPMFNSRHRTSRSKSSSSSSHLRAFVPRADPQVMKQCTNMLFDEHSPAFNIIDTLLTSRKRIRDEHADIDVSVLKKSRGGSVSSTPSNNPFCSAMDTHARVTQRTTRGGRYAVTARGQSKRGRVSTRGGVSARGGRGGYARANAVGYTANGAVAHASSGVPTVDLFYALCRGLEHNTLHELLSAAWQHDAHTTLCLILQTRSTRQDFGGKGEKSLGVECMSWLRKNKQRTYLSNLLLFIQHGYFKDLLTLSLSHCQDHSVPFELQLLAEFLKADYMKLKSWHDAKRAWKQLKAEEKKAAANKEAAAATDAPPSVSAPMSASSSSNSLSSASTTIAECADEFVQLHDEDWEDVSVIKQGVDTMEIVEDYAAIANSNSNDAAKQCEMKVESEQPAVPETVTTVVAPVIETPAAPVEPDTHCFISLAAKWAPSEKKSFDHFNTGNMAKKMALLLFGQGSKTSTGKPAERRDLSHCLARYRKLLSTLRGHLDITERHCCADRWPVINFSTVPAKCHQMLKAAFVKHDGDRYRQYLVSLKTRSNGAKINVNGLMPHELIKHYVDAHSYNPTKVDDTVEMAWQAMLEATRAGDKVFPSAISVVDVSGSMTGLPMQVAVALGLFVSELSAAPFNNRVITFSANPTWHEVKGANLFQRVQNLKTAQWGMNTNINAVFTMILNMAKQHSIAQEHMPSRLFIFSDMQFDQACPNGRKCTNVDGIRAQYAQAGYNMPQLIFWNLNGRYDRSMPIRADENGMCMISGFSTELVKLFMSDELQAYVPSAQAPANNAMDPVSVMMKAIAKFAPLVKLDPEDE